MTYLQFLGVFLVLPSILMILGAILHRADPASGLSAIKSWWRTTLIHCGIALVYTTPWDNFLVANGVWMYDPDRVIGWRMGWVPLEEYMFFVLQPILVGSWLAFRWRTSGGWIQRSPIRSEWRWAMALSVLALWAASIAAWRIGGPSWTYMALILIWGLPPLLLQIAFGGDLIWARRREVWGLWLVPAFYLSAADALVIRMGIWQISERWSTGWQVLGLPVEEGVFFFLTTGLLVNGNLLMILPESRGRLQLIRKMISDRLSGRHLGFTGG